tara:strand:- start:1107 stop:1313 length:207 start_codon:yes stop_codon:yes gene_type:complete
MKADIIHLKSQYLMKMELNNNRISEIRVKGSDATNCDDRLSRLLQTQNIEFQHFIYELKNILGEYNGE